MARLFPLDHPTRLFGTADALALLRPIYADMIDDDVRIVSIG